MCEDAKVLIFENLKRLAAVTVKMLGKNYEIAIHDFSKLPHSLIHIEGTITNRKIGAPVTDLIIKQLRAEGDNVKDISNYKTVTKTGQILKSSSTFIQDDKGKVIGVYCSNFAITDFLNATSCLNELIQTETITGEDKKETFASTLDETIDSLMASEIRQIGKQPVSMTKEERLELLLALECKGLFMLRGAIDHVAKLCGVSKYTIYNNLKEIRTGDKIL